MKLWKSQKPIISFIQKMAACIFFSLFVGSVLSCGFTTHNVSCYEIPSFWNKNTKEKIVCFQDFSLLMGIEPKIFILFYFILNLFPQKRKKILSLQTNAFQKFFVLSLYTLFRFLVLNFFFGGGNFFVNKIIGCCLSCPRVGFLSRVPTVRINSKRWKARKCCECWSSFPRLSLRLWWWSWCGRGFTLDALSQSSCRTHPGVVSFQQNLYPRRKRAQRKSYCFHARCCISLHCRFELARFRQCSIKRRVYSVSFL